MAFDLQTGENHSIVVYLYGDKTVRIIKDFSIISISSYWISSSVRIRFISQWKFHPSGAQTNLEADIYDILTETWSSECVCVCNEMSPCHKPHSDQLELGKKCPGKLAGEKMVWWEDGPFRFLCWSSVGQFRTPVILSRLIDSDSEASYKCFAKMIEMFFPSPLVIILIDIYHLKKTHHTQYGGAIMAGRFIYLWCNSVVPVV